MNSKKMMKKKIRAQGLYDKMANKLTDLGIT